MSNSLACTLPDFNWRLVVPQQVAQIHHIHQQALRGAEHGLVRCDELAQFERHTGQDGLMVGCSNGRGKLVAYGVLGLDSPTTTHLAELLDIKRDQQRRFAILDGAAALPGWRGYGLHQAAIEQRLLQAASLGRSLLGATVAPRNHYSLVGLLRSGFAVSASAQLYGGLERLLLQKDSAAPVAGWHYERRVEIGNVRAHRAALALGLQGYACERDSENRWQLLYGRPQLAQAAIPATAVVPLQLSGYFASAAVHDRAGATHRSLH